MDRDFIISRNKMRARRAQRQHGQTLIIALVCMFVLLFIGGIFVGLVARNLQNGGRDKDSAAAKELSRAGVAFCDSQLMNSPDGADWRPAPTQPINAQDPDYLWLQTGDWTRILLTNGRALVRVTYEPKFITDVKNPVLSALDPLSKMLKIESIGRPGILDPTDPTTFLNTPSPRLRRQQLAYKAIGVTDYMLWDTNINNESKFKSFIGLPPVSVPVPSNYSGHTYPLSRQLGGMNIRTPGLSSPNYLVPGGPIRVNGDVQLIGNTIFGIRPRLSERITVSGSITAELPTTDLPLNTVEHPNDVIAGPRLLNLDDGTVSNILNTSNPDFTTANGLIRDDSSDADKFGYARGASRLDPPRVDYIDASTGQTRYRQLTLNSGRLLTNGGSTINTGKYTMGAGFYIDNYSSIEPETKNVQNGRSIRTVWLSPQLGQSARWYGQYYVPLGSYIDMGYPTVQQRDPATSELVPDSSITTPGFQVYRDDAAFRDPSRIPVPDSTIRLGQQTEAFTFFIYKPVGQRPVIKLENDFNRLALKTKFGMTEKGIDKFLPAFNGVIYAEGNIRIRGLLASKLNMPIRRENGGEANSPTDNQIYGLVNPASLTVVSGANIYIEGSIIHESPDSMISLLATEYVTVNTTMFNSVTDAANKPFAAQDQGAAAFTPFLVGQSPTNSFSWSVTYGDNPALYVDDANVAINQHLLVTHGSDGPNGTYVNLFVNEFARRASNSPLYYFRPEPAPGTIDPIYGQIHGFTAPVNSNANNVNANLLNNVLDLTPKSNGATYLYTGDVGYPFPQGFTNTFRLAVDATYSSRVKDDYKIARAAVVPLDIRIEALIYAQNGSFYIIPGTSVNQDTRDTQAAALALATISGLPAGTMQRPAGTDSLFPFYGEPMDCRITVVGAIAENRSAPLGDQTAWMQLWGWIPEVFGSTGKDQNPVNPATEKRIPKAHQYVDEVGGAGTDIRLAEEKQARIARGLRIIYDPALNQPYLGYDINKRAFRCDDAFYDQTNLNKTRNPGRILPPTPRLPVCPGFVYYGEVK